ncbi:hypothetical protein [Dinghuibacter silviterrae]|uniref:Uncharacterized protein n=1 Tax=Dinghuibacter silviterrae TaxID=1539049 RepID=A0A4R8DHC7_9BACT|nr:hypothetical protein [Dinghuibacter silviterrae]TDW97121.1 hypothetical protein EDB95_4962 [Dinghuibacter silviterrae]
MPLPKTDILDKWKSATWEFSTGHYEEKLLKEKIGFIYDRLKTNFGASYFVVNERLERPLEKIPWLFSLLRGRDYEAGIEALLEIAELIEYMNGLDESIRATFRDLRSDPRCQRDFFFELYVFRKLDRAGIVNEKKVMHGVQELEGTCLLEGKPFLFECRKLYAPRLDEMDIKCRVFQDLTLVGERLKHACGMICTIHFNKPIQGRHRDNFSSKIRQFFTGFNQLTAIPDIQYIHNDNLGTFKAVNYDKAVLEKIEQEQDYEILYYLEQTDEIAENGLPLFKGKIITNFHLSKAEVYKKFKQVLKEKKKQHKRTGFEHQVIFLDSESINELYFGLFANDRVYDIEEVKRVYNELKLDCIVCVIRRDYRMPRPVIWVDILRPERLAAEAARLKVAFE